ncbi:stage II sporulation protein R [Paenibacillus sp. CAU 1782]
MSRTYSSYSSVSTHSISTHLISGASPANSYRFSYRKSYGFIIMALLVLIMSWESGRMDAAVAQGNIPQEAIRLRILANSDSPTDQAVKRVVRDEVVKAMNSWAVGLKDISEARAAIESRLPEVEGIVANVLESRGFAHDASAILGNVQFPTKMYGSKVYPAGEYEALLITIGEGEGQNWWCVLFPPLCFIDAATGEASAASATQAAADSEVNEVGESSSEVEVGQSGKSLADGSVEAAGQKGNSSELADSKGQNAEEETPEVRFFLWELIERIIDWFKSLF